MSICTRRRIGRQPLALPEIGLVPHREENSQIEILSLEKQRGLLQWSVDVKICRPPALGRHMDPASWGQPHCLIRRQVDEGLDSLKLKAFLNDYRVAADRQL